MKIHEYQAAQIFKEAGIRVPEGRVIQHMDEAESAVGKIGFPLVLKAQVLVGGRGKAGGVKIVKEKGLLQETLKQLSNLSIKGYPVEKIYAVEAIDIKKEIYLAVTVDNIKGDVVVIASSEGGVEIEEVAKKNPEAIKKLYLEGAKNPPPDKLETFVSSLFDESTHKDQATEIVNRLVALFFDNDCSLAEINPLVIDGKGNLIAADAKINIDDNALARHEELAELRDMSFEDKDEIEAKEKNLSFVKLDGNVGCIVNGAGLAMATMDIIKLVGGEPANFLDVGGSSSPEKVTNAVNIILRNKNIKAILINIFGGITRCDDIAKGLIEAKNSLEIPVPLVIRLTGTNEKEAKELLSQEGIETYATMRDAVKKVVELAGSS